MTETEKFFLYLRRFTRAKRERESTDVFIRILPARYFRIRNHLAGVISHTVNTPARIVNFYFTAVTSTTTVFHLSFSLRISFILFLLPRGLLVGKIFAAKSLTRFLAVSVPKGRTLLRFTREKRQRTLSRFFMSHQNIFNTPKRQTSSRVLLKPFWNSFPYFVMLCNFC